jgi:uncharacterized damage-inducible protein DinB
VEKVGEHLESRAPAHGSPGLGRDTEIMERHDPLIGADERTSLNQYLDYHRATLVQKVTGVSIDALRSIPIASTQLSLAGLLKHLALVEDSWFQEDFLGRQMPEPWASAPFDDDRDWEFHSAQTNTAEELLELYRAACDRSRAVVDDADSLDQRSVRVGNKEVEGFSLRWILLHMIEETARHNGHADLLREAIDGVVGE